MPPSWSSSICVSSSVSTCRPRHRVSAWRQRLVSAVSVLLFLMFMSPFGPGRIPKHFVDALDLFRSEQGSDQEVVKELYRMGLQPGDHIASLTFSNLGTVM
jgi:hypothetical protein